MDIDVGNPEPVYKQKTPNFLDLEADWMAAEGYYAQSNKARLRNIALRRIVQLSKYGNCDAFIPYAAMNLFDRFISRHEVPRILDKGDDVILAADACLSLSWSEREKTNSCLHIYDELLDGNKNANMESEERMKRTVRIVMMEAWIRKSVKVIVTTPISFLGFFAGLVKPVGNGIKQKILNELVVQTQGDIKFTRFLPTSIAASAVLTACKILHNPEYDEKKMIDRISSFVDKEDMQTCLEEIEKMCMEKQIVRGKDEGSEQEQIQHQPKAKSDPHMNFELKWMKETRKVLEEWPIKSPATQNQEPDEDVLLRN